METQGDKSIEAKPLISVVIPTRHRNDVLALCLDCLAPGAQSLLPNNYEVIVTDDGTHSNAEEMIRARYPWARWVGGPRMGPGANRNSGAGYADGSYVAFTDDDCLPSRDWLKSFHDAIDKNVDFYEGRTTCEFGLHSPMDEAPVNQNGNLFWACNLMVRKSAFFALGGYDKEFQFWCEDIDFRERLKHSNQSTRFVAGAAVDHPPRKRKLGRSAIAMWKAHVQVWVKHGAPIPAPTSFAILVGKTRVSEVLRYRWTRESFQALGAAFYESLVVLLNSKAWTRQFRLQYLQGSQNVEPQNPPGAHFAVAEDTAR